MSSQKDQRGPAADVNDDTLDPPAREKIGEGISINRDVTPVVTVIMPTLDEEAGIETCIRDAIDALEDVGLPGEIIVSDSSTDRTPEIARSLGATVVEPDRSGYGYAYRYAFEHARGEYIVIGDADTTYDFRELPRLLDPVRSGRADLVLGSRLAGDIKPGAMPPLHRWIGNPLLTVFLNRFYDVEVTDAHSGFRVFHRDVINKLDLQSDGMEFASEMVMEAGAKDLRIEEVPITYHPRTGEPKLDSLRDGWRHVKFMLTNAPGYLFSWPGLGMTSLGALIMAAVYSEVELMGQAFGIHSLIAGSLLTILGYQVASFGMLTEVAAEPIRRHEDVLSRWIHRHASLERGMVIGVVLFVVGAVSAGILILQWIESGYTELPVVSADILAFTLIVLGIQTVFVSFFGSIVRRSPDEEESSH